MRLQLPFHSDLASLLDAGLDPSYDVYADTDMDPTFQFDADPDPQHCLYGPR